MKRLLLDTHAFLWWLGDNDALGAHARDAISDSRNDVYVSAATLWEIGIKRALGKLEAPDDLTSVVTEEKFIPLPIQLPHAEVAGQLPLLHRDPFDRMLVAQAQLEGLVVVTADGFIPQYGVRVLSASS